MRRRPWGLVILAICHIFAPIGNVIFNAVISRKNIFDYLLFALSPKYLQANWIMILAPIVAGVAIYACKKWSFYVYMLSITVLFLFSYQGYMSKAGSISLAPVIFVYVVNVLVVVYFLVPAVRNIYFDRRMRWWEAKPRYECDYKAQWKFVEDEIVHDGEVSNISVNGLFLKSFIMPRDQDMIEMKIPFNDGVECALTGQVIFHKKAKAIGFGVQFEHSKESKKMATEITSHLESQGRRIANLDVRPEDSFTFWIRTLLTTGKGLLPFKEKRS